MVIERLLGMVPHLTRNSPAAAGARSKEHHLRAVVGRKDLGLGCSNQDLTLVSTGRRRRSRRPARRIERCSAPARWSSYLESPGSWPGQSGLPFRASFTAATAGSNPWAQRKNRRRCSAVAPKTSGRILLSPLRLPISPPGHAEKAELNDATAVLPVPTAPAEVDVDHSRPCRVRILEMGAACPSRQRPMVHLAADSQISGAVRAGRRLQESPPEAELSPDASRGLDRSLDCPALFDSSSSTKNAQTHETNSNERKRYRFWNYGERKLR
jgi:hypothetical protein